jgi:hypothetical protein
MAAQAQHAALEDREQADRPRADNRNIGGIMRQNFLSFI